jgi:hypothetical protein
VRGNRLREAEAEIHPSSEGSYALLVRPSGKDNFETG